jgi:tetratricopeptide (TPR) repeat protein
MRGERVLLLGLALSLPAGNAGAQGVEPIAFDGASTIATEVDGDIAKMRRDLDLAGRGYAATVPSEVGRVERRLREGEIHFLLNDYLRASIVLLDVVDDPTNKSHPRYDECLYLLAQSLAKSKNYSGARQYFEDLLPRVRGERLKDVVLALLEISSATDHYEDVERYIARLREAGTLSRPDVDYIYGKMLFKGSGSNPEQVQRAYEVFRSVPTGSSISGQASYYAGVALVKLGRFDDAIRQFNDALTRIPAHRDSTQLRELTYISLGRLYQETGDVSKAADAYQEISQASPYFGDMLYEVAWAHVRAANTAAEGSEERKQAYVRALRSTELLMATAPSSRLYPQARILEGNLQIRLGAEENAYDTFQTIIDRYGAARDKLDLLLMQSPDPRQFFDQLVAADLGQIGATTILPPVALSWALEEDQMVRAVAMNQDLSESQKFLKESNELVRTLTESLEGEGRYGIFPGMAQVRAKSLSIENRMLNVNRRLLNLERRMVWPHVGTQDQASLDSIHARAAQLETEIQTLPQSEEEVVSAQGNIKESYQVVGRRTYRQAYRVSQMRAQVVAVELWINANRDQLNQEELKLLEERIKTAQAEIEALEADLEGVASELRTSEAVASGDAGRGRASNLRRQYAELLAQETQLMRSMRDRVPGELQSVTARIDQQRTALAQIDQDLQSLTGSLDSQVEKRVGEIKGAVAAEAERIRGYQGEHAELSSTTGEMLGPVAARTLNDVGKQFNNLVLQADVGIIDVAWARKQAETKKVNDLIKEQTDRTLELESEFSDVLEE